MEKTLLSYNLNKIDLELYKKLLESGINVNEEDENKITLLYECAINIGYAAILNNRKKERKLIKLLKLLVSYGADIDHRIYNGWTALIEVAERGFTNSVKTLLMLGADLNIQDNYGQTALIHATENNHIETIEILLNYTANVELVDKEGQTALMKAANECFLDSLKALLNVGANRYTRDFNGMTALDLAKQRLQLAEYRKNTSIFSEIYPLNELNRCLAAVKLLDY